MSSEYIPTIKQNPIKNFGKRFDNTLKDSVAIQETKDILEVLLDKVDTCGLPGRYKAWIYQHVILAKVLWSLSIYEFTASSIEQIEKDQRPFTKMVYQSVLAALPFTVIPIHFNAPSKVL